MWFCELASLSGGSVVDRVESSASETRFLDTLASIPLARHVTDNYALNMSLGYAVVAEDSGMRGRRTFCGMTYPIMNEAGFSGSIMSKTRRLF